MFTVIAYRQNVIANTGLLAHTPVADVHVRVAGNDIYVPPLNRLAAILANGSNITAAQLTTPSLRQRTLFDVAPCYQVADPTFTTNPLYLRENPLTLVPGEQLDFLAQSNSATATTQNGIAWLADGPISPVTTEAFTVKATGATTLVAGAWTAVPLTFTQTLPVGDYDVLGVAAVSAGCIVARLVFVGGLWRPGVPGQASLNDQGYPAFRFGRFGSFGRFNYLTPPQLEFLSATADTAETVLFDLARV